MSASSGLAMTVLLLGAGFLTGTKLLMLGLVFGALTFPNLFQAWWREQGHGDAQPVRLRGLLVLLSVIAVGGGAWSLRTVAQEQQIADAVRPRAYRAMGEWIKTNATATEMLVAPWDDMPGFFMYGGEQRYMAGFNVQFLRDQDPVRFNAYVFFERGLVEDPEATMVRMFDGARFVITRRDPRSEGEAMLVQRLATRREHFDEVASPALPWRIFRRKPLSGEGAP